MPERAEIEAVAAILRGWGPTLGRGVRITEVAQEILAALDRVRDARGDDEGPKVTVEPGRRPFDPAKAARSPQSEDHKHSWHPVWRCRHCGLVQPPAPSRDARGDDEAVRDDHDGHWTTTYHRCASCGAMTSAARFPQGEDHEAGIRAMLAEAEGRGLRMRTDDGAEVAAMDEADVRALAAAYLSATGVTGRGRGLAHDRGPVGVASA